MATSAMPAIRRQADANGQPSRLRGSKHRDGDGNPFGNVVHRNGQGQGQAQRRALQGGKEGGQPFWQVVRTDGDGSEQADLAQMDGAVGSPLRLVLVQTVVRIGQQPVQYGDQQQATEEGRRCPGRAKAGAMHAGEGNGGLGQDFSQ